MGADVRSSAEIFQGSSAVPSRGACSTIGDGGQEGGGVFHVGSAGSGMKNLRCWDINAFNWGLPSLSPVNRYPPLRK